MSTRDKSIDQAAGLMLLMVMLGHVLDWCNLSGSLFWTILQYFFFFRMPWFFFKGGMFYREKEIGQQVRSDFYKLIVPYILFFAVSTVVDGLAMWQNGGTLISVIHVVGWQLLVSGAAPGNSAVWFFVVFFLVKALYGVLHNRLRMNDILIMGGGITILLIVNLLKQRIGDSPVLKYPEYLWSTFVGVVFYSAGHLLKDKQYNKVTFAVSLAVYIAIAILAFSYVDVHHNELRVGYYSLWIILALAGIICLNNIVRHTSKIYCSKLLDYIGENSCALFATHFIVGMFAKLTVITPLGITSQYQMLMIYLLFLVIFLPLITKLLNKDNLKIFIGKYQPRKEGSGLGN